MSARVQISPSTVLRTLLRFGVAVALIAAGASKLGDPTAFATQIANYRMGATLAPYLAATLPVSEIVVGLAALAMRGPWRRAALLGAAGVFAVFLVAVSAAFFRGINIECGCFGSGGGPISLFTVGRNVGLVAAALLALRLER